MGYDIEIGIQTKMGLLQCMSRSSHSALTAPALGQVPEFIGITSVLHTWGSAMTHHPHVHMIVPGGGLSEDGTRWIACRPGFFLPVRVLSRLFRRLVLEMLIAAHAAKKLAFFGVNAGLAEPQAFAAFLAPLKRCEWVVYSKKPFGGPEAVLDVLPFSGIQTTLAQP